MYLWIQMCLLTGLLLTMMLFDASFSDVYTSSRKIEDMVIQEMDILNNLQAAVTETNNATALLAFFEFREHRIKTIRERDRFGGLKEYLNHPNALYHSVVEFAVEYEKLRSALGNMTSPSVQIYLSMIADSHDLVGARRSLIRLQNIYNLSVWNMMKGDYLGYQGPELGEQDAVNLGEIAFQDGYLDISLAWMKEALNTTIGHPMAANSNPDVYTPSKSYILAKISAIYIRQGRLKAAKKMYKKAKHLGPTEGHIMELEQEFQRKPRVQPSRSPEEGLKGFCLPPEKLTKTQLDPRLNCEYREAILPYYRFQQELLSISPYISVFYNFLTDSESDEMVRSASMTLRRAMVQVDHLPEVDEYRTGQTSHLRESESSFAQEISKRIGAVTYLDTWKHRQHCEGLFSSEDLEIVNYGLGGSYNLHYDVLHERGEYSNPDDTKAFRRSGNRLSTFILYLSDVTLGGATVFPHAEIFVKPLKNMALFWYNYLPSGQQDGATMHAGCPVVIGHKWIANKWISSHQNTFTRRCGLAENSSQLDIDKYMRYGWH